MDTFWGGFSKKENEPYYSNKDFLRIIGAESMVLLKNEGVLPVQAGRVALFGAGAIDTIFCGTNSNYVPNPGKVNVYEGLKNGGFSFSTEVWLKKMQKATRLAAKETEYEDIRQKTLAGLVNHPDEVAISKADLAESVLGTDTCIYVLRRATIEQQDRKYAAGDFTLSEVEEENLKLITESFKNIILVLNAGILEIGSLVKSKNIKAILLMGIDGMEAGNSLCDVLTGAVNPSGHLSDTWAKKYKDYPACNNFSKKERASLTVDYKEGIYVGYRYFGSYEVAPLFPFGFGLSYTKFEMKLTFFEANWFYLIFRIKVKNVGQLPGRAVAQIYVSAPAGSLDKPYQELKGFDKTGVLNPGNSEELVIKIPTKALASFSEKKSAWIMERGEYIFRIGENSRDTSVAAKMVLNKQTVIENVANVIAPDHEMEFLSPPERAKEETGFVLAASLANEDLSSHSEPVKKQDTITTYVFEGSNYTSYINKNKFAIPFKCKEKIEYVRPMSCHSLVDVVSGKTTMEAFVASLSPEILARICSGAWEESKKQTDMRLKLKIKPKKFTKASGRSSNQFAAALGIPGVSFADGPAGLHIEGITACCYPSATNLAQTWDLSLVKKVGDLMGQEMDYFDVDYILAPAVNIHRDPMAGRGYEYYSEDPFLSGVMGSFLIDGIQQHKGRGAVIKHFAVYNREEARQVVDCNVSRRALREIYLKAFEICIENGKPKGVMNSHNKINGIYASSLRSLNIDILRGEWGFKGFVMSEWGTMSDKSYDLHGGCDIIMPGFDPDKILHTMMETSPKFEPDGYVKETTRESVLDRPRIYYDSWGSFLPDKDGEDEAFAYVRPGATLSPKIAELEKDGVCTVKTDIDGSRVVCYKGTDRGAYLALGDLQLCAIHLLNAFKDSAAMENILNQVK